MPVQQEAPSCQSQGTGFCSVEALRQSLRVFLTTLVPVAANDSVSGEDVFRIVQTLSRWMKTKPAQGVGEGKSSPRLPSRASGEEHSTVMQKLDIVADRTARDSDDRGRSQNRV
jgi:hypothetical protein